MDADTHKVCPGCQGRAKPEHRFCPTCGHDLESVATSEGDLWLGVTIEGRYRLDEAVGTGAMGRVYRATQTNLGKSFAVKVLHSHLTNDASSRDRFANEAHNAASLNHPNVVSVVDYGSTADEMTYLVMEFVEGKSLEAIIEEEYPLNRSRVVDLCVQILAALTEAHGLNILHRDLKPENILVKTVKTHGEMVKVLDFGIAKLMDESEPSRDGLTGHGMVCGTPEYMSPEQARGRRLDPRSDLYAVGVILYQMLAGRVPFSADNAIEVLQHHINTQAPAPSTITKGPPDPLEAVCLRAMAKDPAERFESAATFRDALVRALREEVGHAVVCVACSAPLAENARFCAACGASNPAQARHRARTRAITKISEMSLPAMHDDSLGVESQGRTLPLPLLNRDKLQHWMHEHIAESPSELTFAVLRGAGGDGKTRALSELTSMAARAGWRVVTSGPEPFGAAPSLWPIRNIVSQLLGFSLSDVTTHTLGRSANLAGLSFETLPGLAELFDLEGPARGAEISVRRRECFSATVEALTLGDFDRPTMIALDDIDRFDAASRAILRRLRRSNAHTPVLVVCTTAESDITWLDAAHFPLQPLSESHLSGTLSEDDQDLATLAPMPPMELVHRIRLRQRDVDALAPGDITALAKRRVESLPGLERAVLEAVAVCGDAVNEPLMDSIILRFFSERPQRALDDALANLHIAGLLCLDRDGGRAFGHRSIRDVVYAEIPSRRRRQLHRIYAEHPAFESCVTTVAMHRLKSKPIDAVAALEQAADAAAAAFDDGKSASLLRAALRAFERASSKADDAAVEDAGLRYSIARLECKLADVLRLTGQHDAALDLSTKHELHEHPSLAASSILTTARIFAAQGRFEDAIGYFNRAFGPLLAEGELHTILNTYSELARVHLQRGEPERGLGEVMEGLALCTLGEGPRALVDLPLWRYHLSVSELHRSAGQLDEAVTWANHALFQAERTNQELALLRTHAHLAFLMRLVKRPTSAEQHQARALEHARNFGDRLSTAEILLERAKVRAARGELEDARRSCEEALRLSVEVKWHEGTKHAQDALIRLSEGIEAAPESVGEGVIPSPGS